MMRPRVVQVVTSLATGGLVVLLARVGSPQAPMPGPGSPGLVPDASLTTLVVGLGVAALLGAALAVAWFDRRSRRETEAVALQSRLADALMRDPLLAELPVVVTVELPTWRGSPASVQVRGDVPTPDLRDQVIRFVAREATSQRTDCRIEDRLMVLPGVARPV